jgi:hypothetical protein
MALIDIVLTKEWLAERWLVGVRLTDPVTGLPFPDAHYAQALQFAVAQTTEEFSVVFGGETYEDSVDTTAWSASSDWLTNLRFKPLIEVLEVSFWRGNNKGWIVPPGWILRPADKFSQIQIKPDSSSGGPIFVSGQYHFGMDYFYRASNMRVSYRAGFDDLDGGMVYAIRDRAKVFGVGTSWRGQLKIGDIVGFADREARVVTAIRSQTEIDVDRAWAEDHGTALAPEPFLYTRIPPSLIEYIGAIAAKQLLLTAGELVIAAGVASSSRSINGMSQSLNTTASAENTAFSARIMTLDKQREEIRKRILRNYRPINMAVF